MISRDPVKEPTLKKNVLITGINGFLGRHAADYFYQKGYSVYGMARSQCLTDGAAKAADVVMSDAEITVASLRDFNVDFDCIVHCAGGSSVARSIENPLGDFKNTVVITMEILEFIRLHSPHTRLIYPSSASVYGEHDASKISIHDALHPVSPYGVHKKITEELCLDYRRTFAIDVIIIRFFSIYGQGLKKQLIWDACNKISKNPAGVEFWGTGSETRDWIYIDDALSLIGLCATLPNVPPLINGGCGKATTIRQTLELLVAVLGSNTRINFNGMVKPGDPCHYQADMAAVFALGWQPATSLHEGLQQYVNWFQGISHD